MNTEEFVRHLLSLRARTLKPAPWPPQMQPGSDSVASWRTATTRAVRLPASSSATAPAPEHTFRGAVDTLASVLTDIDV
jgi:hypothetical protein